MNASFSTPYTLDFSAAPSTSNPGLAHRASPPAPMIPVEPGSSGITTPQYLPTVEDNAPTIIPSRFDSPPLPFDATHPDVDMLNSEERLHSESFNGLGVIASQMSSIPVESNMHSQPLHRDTPGDSSVSGAHHIPAPSHSSPSPFSPIVESSNAERASSSQLEDLPGQLGDRTAETRAVMPSVFTQDSQPGHEKLHAARNGVVSPSSCNFDDSTAPRNNEGSTTVVVGLEGSPKDAREIENSPTYASDLETSAAALLSLGHGTSRRVRPTARDPLKPAESRTFDQLFDKQSVATSAVRNPLADMMKERAPSTNSAPETSHPHAPHEDTSSTEDSVSAAKESASSANKENVSSKSKGRGRPAGKTVSPDQLIKPTKDSLTTRNLFALEYKEANRAFPTEAMWQSLDKAELTRLENLSKEKKAARKSAKGK